MPREQLWMWVQGRPSSITQNLRHNVALVSDCRPPTLQRIPIIANHGSLVSLVYGRVNDTHTTNMICLGAWYQLNPSCRINQSRTQYYGSILPWTCNGSHSPPQTSTTGSYLECTIQVVMNPPREDLYRFSLKQVPEQRIDLVQIYHIFGWGRYT